MICTFKAMLSFLQMYLNFFATGVLKYINLIQVTFSASELTWQECLCIGIQTIYTNGQCLNNSQFPVGKWRKADQKLIISFKKTNSVVNSDKGYIFEVEVENHRKLRSSKAIFTKKNKDLKVISLLVIFIGKKSMLCILEL